MCTSACREPAAPHRRGRRRTRRSSGERRSSRGGLRARGGVRGQGRISLHLHAGVQGGLRPGSGTGHFDTGSAPDTHRYYCLVNPKTGRNEPNAVSGQTVSRRDGTTGVSGVAVSPLSCADAEQKGLLITSGYVLPRGAPSAKAGVSGNAVPPPAQPAAAAAPVAAPPSAVAAAAVAAPAVATAPAAVAVPTAP